MGFLDSIFGSSQSDRRSSMPVLPDELRPIFYGPNGAVTQLGEAQGVLPSLAQLPGLTPKLDVPGMTPEMQDQIDRILSQANYSPEMQAALRQLQELTSGPIGSSPATAAGMKAFSELVAPTIMSAQAAQGTAGGGAAIEAMGQGATFAALPLIQQEIATRQAAVSQYGQLAQQQINQLVTALEAAGVPREVAMQQALAAYEQQQNKWQAEYGLQAMPLGLMGNLIGSEGEGEFSYSPSLASNIGQILSLGKGMKSLFS